MLPVTSNPLKFTAAISLIRYQKAKIKRIESDYIIQKITVFKAQFCVTLSLGSIFIWSKLLKWKFSVQAVALSDSNFKTISSKNFTGYGHFKNNENTISSIVGLRNPRCMTPYNLRHEYLEILCLEELLMDVVDLKWEFNKFERIEFIGISLWLYNFSSFQQN